MAIPSTDIASLRALLTERPFGLITDQDGTVLLTSDCNTYSIMTSGSPRP